MFTDTGCYNSKNQLLSARQNSTLHRKKPEVKGSALGLEVSSLKPFELHRFTLTKEPFSLTAPAALGLASLNPNPNHRGGLILSSQVPEDSCEGKNLDAALLLFLHYFFSPAVLCSETEKFFR